MADPATRTTVSKTLWIGLLGAVLFVGGLLVGSSMRAVIPGRELGSEDSRVARIEQALGDLQRELARLRGSVEDASKQSSLVLAPSSERVAASAESSMDAAIERIEKAPRELGPSHTSDRTHLVLTALGHASLVDVRRDFERRGGREADRDEVQRDMTNAHMLWTVDELIERYGSPRRVDWKGGSLELAYGFDGGESLYPKPYARFVIRDGFVVYADVELE